MEAVRAVRQRGNIDATQGQVTGACTICVGPGDPAVRTVRRPAGRHSRQRHDGAN